MAVCRGPVEEYYTMTSHHGVQGADFYVADGMRIPVRLCDFHYRKRKDRYDRETSERRVTIILKEPYPRLEPGEPCADARLTD